MCPVGRERLTSTYVSSGERLTGTYVSSGKGEADRYLCVQWEGRG